MRWQLQLPLPVESWRKALKNLTLWNNKTPPSNTLLRQATDPEKRAPAPEFSVCVCVTKLAFEHTFPSVVLVGCTCERIHFDFNIMKHVTIEIYASVERNKHYQQVNIKCSMTCLFPGTKREPLNISNSFLDWCFVNMWRLTHWYWNLSFKDRIKSKLGFYFCVHIALR